MRRKPVIILITLALAFASCSMGTHDSITRETMVFSAVASHSNVKGIITTTNYPVDVPFIVEAVHYPEGIAQSAGSSYVSDETISYDAVHGVWRPEGDIFWPANGDVVFYAGSPILHQVRLTPDKGVVADWEINTLEDSHVDLCVAKTTEKCEDHPTVVPIVFSHALSQVCFKARCLQNYSTSQRVDDMVQADVITVVLDSVKVTDVLSKGHFTQSPFGWEVDPVHTAGYTVYSNPQGLELRCDRYDNPVLNYLNTVLMIPQVLSGDARIEEWHHCVVRSSVTNVNTGEIVSDVTYPVSGHSSIPIRLCGEKWNPDYKYTYRIAVGLQSENTVISLAVTDWTETKEIILGDE